MKKVFLAALLMSSMAMEAQQSFAGFRESPYAGVLQSTTNPAYMISSKRSWDASLFVANVGFGNDAMKLTADIMKDFNNFAKTDTSNPLLNRNDINARINIDVLGPSVFVKINDKHAAGITTRLRAMVNINQFDAKMIQSYIQEYDKLELKSDYKLDLNNQEIVGHAFSEVNFSWAGELYFDGNNALKAGASLKYLMGAGNLYAGFRDFSGTASITFDEINRKTTLNIESNSGVLDVVNGGSNFLNFSNFNSNSLMGKEAAGIGFDLGVIYEFRFDSCRTCHNKPHDLRIGFSIMDIGSITYKAHKESFRYTMPDSGKMNLALEDLDRETLEKAFGADRMSKLEGKEVKSSLPTTMNLSADYHIWDGFYVNASGLINLVGKSKTGTYNPHYASTFSLTPRFDSNSLGAYLPISYDQLSKTSVGIGLRLGPLTVGSSSAISNFVTKSGRDLNFFVGLRFGHMSYPTY